MPSIRTPGGQRGRRQPPAPAPRSSLRGGRPTGRGVGEQGIPRRKVLLWVSAVLTVLIGLGLLLGGQEAPADHDVVVIAEKTTRSPGVLTEEIRQRIDTIAKFGGGRLVVHAVGARDSALRPVDLDVLREGEPENDPSRRHAVIGHRLTALASELDAVPVGREGFNLVAALQVAANASSKTDEQVEIWLQTTLLSSSNNPLRMSVLAAADPAAAVEEVVKATAIGTLDLSRVDLHPVLVAPVGTDQELLSPADEAWSTAFVTELGTALGATVHPPILSESTGPPWTAASIVPPIAVREEPTPEPPPDPDGEPPVVLDTAGFVPNTATLLDLKGTRGKLAGLVDRYEKANRRYTIEVKGFTAAFGDTDSARVLSQKRAAVLGDLLFEAGVPRTDIDSLGVGYDERADPTSPPQSAAQRVVIIRLLPRS